MSTWTTKDGKEIPIKDLKDRHLLNIHRMLRETIEKTKFYSSAIGTCWYPRGEMAQAMFEEEYEYQLEAELQARSRLVVIDKEVKIRGLKELPLREEFKPLPEMELVEDLGYGTIYRRKD